MDNSSHLIIVSILEARNILKENYKCKDYILVEARFNNESLLSDRIPLTSPSPELLTELCWELDRKSLQLFRKERKPIKLQCFLENENQSEKQLVGYIILDLREAQESSEPQFSWRPLLHSKFKGLAHLRPELLVCLQFVKSTDLGGGNGEANGLPAPSKGLPKDTSGATKSLKNDIISSEGNLTTNKFHGTNGDLEMDINVRFKDGVLHIWDSTKSLLSREELFLTITILKSSNLHKLMKLPAKLKEAILFHFRVNFFGTSSRSNDFIDLRSENGRNEEMHFHLIIDSISTLHAYLQIHSLELQLCDNKSKVLGFTTINIAKILKENLRESRISGTFQLLSNDGTIACEEPYPSVQLVIRLDKELPNTEDVISAAQRELLQPIITMPHHYCLTIDVRSMKINNRDDLPIGPCFARYSYPLFRYKEFHTSEVRFTTTKDYIFEEGFCAFNFLASPAKLETTLQHVPFTLEVLDASQHKKRIGMATIKLKSLFHSPFPEQKENKSVHLPVITTKGCSIGEIHLILNLENFGVMENGHLKESSPHFSSVNNACLNADEIDDLLMDAALEIEMWKKKQLDMFEKDLKKRESTFLEDMEKHLRMKEEQHAAEIVARMERIQELENKLKQSFQGIESKAALLEEKKRELDEREENICKRLEKLDEEISKTVSKGTRINLTDNYGVDGDEERVKKLKTIKSKLEERIAQLENELEERSQLIRAYENKYGDLLSLTKDVTGTVIKPMNNTVIRRKINPEKGFRHSFPLNTNLKPNQKAVIGKKRTDLDLDHDRKEEALLLQIERGKKELLSSGLPPSHPIIKEIDSQLNR